MTTKAKGKARVLVLGHGGAARGVERAGGSAKVVDPYDADAIELAERADAILLTGGGDVNPTLYGATPDGRGYGYSDERDLVEAGVVEVAARRGIPVLGICRGSQIMNVALGGTLKQHVDGHGHGTHAVRTAKGSRLRKAVGRFPRARYVTLHHQAVDDVAPGLVAVAWHADGTVEAVEAVEGWMLGVQFHPEMDLSSPACTAIFDAFVAAACRSAGKPVPRIQRTIAVPKDVGKKSARKAAPAKNARRSADSPWERERQNRLAAERRRATRRDPLQRWDSPVLTSWACFRCGVTFDERQDHVDHMLYLHQVAVAQ